MDKYIETYQFKNEYWGETAEFIHIKNGVCLRAYQEYDGELDIDEGEDPETSVSEWSDVADYIDDHMA